MSAELATLALALVATAGFALATSSGLALVWLTGRRWLQRGHPVARARRALCVAVAPSVLPLLLVAVCVAPGFLSLVGLHPDHCLEHTEHAHLCFVHPSAALTVSLAVPLAAAGLLLCLGVAWGSNRLTRWHRQIAVLHMGSPEKLAADVHLLDSPRPFSVTLGLVRPEIWVSSALTAALPRAQLDVVLEHERAHARRRDSLRRLVANVLSLPHWPPVRRWLQHELAVASEQACDEAAGRLVGDRLTVAETILAVERLLARTPTPRHPALLAFGGSAVGERVQSLLAGCGREPARGTLWWSGATLVGAVALLADPLHHLTEHLLSLLLHAR